MLKTDKKKVVCACVRVCVRARECVGGRYVGEEQNLSNAGPGLSLL